MPVSVNTENDVGCGVQVQLELEEQLEQLTVERMLEQFVLQKYSGLVKPGNTAFLIYCGGT